MKEKKRIVALDDFEQRVVIEALADRRNDFLADEKQTEDVNTVILKLLDSPVKKVRCEDEYER